MLSATLFFAALGFATTASAIPHSNRKQDASAYPSNGVCTDYTITTPLTSSDFIWAPPAFSSNFDVATLLFNTSQKDSSTAFAPFAGTKNITKQYTVSATFCSPRTSTNKKENTVLLATHGLGYDRRYWAPTYRSSEYSFAEAVLGQGYSIFFYDRISISGSQPRVSGYENQANNQIAMLSYLSSSIKSGKYTGKVKAEKLVLVGHSFGSFISNALIAAQPSLVDGAVLTGIAYGNETDKSNYAQSWLATAFSARLASSIGHPPFNPQDYDSGYLAMSDEFANVDVFLHNYEEDVANYAQSITQPFGTAELLSLNYLNVVASGYTGKVFLSAGEYDLGVCGGECYSTFEGGLQQAVWSNASVLETYVHPGSGHGLNFNKNATGFYGKIVGFLDRNF